jgi:hydrogenase small subunit
MDDKSETFGGYLKGNGVSRRDFLKFCGMMAATLALPARYTETIAKALASAGARLPIIWLEFQDCTGDSESFLRAAPRSDPLQSNLTDPGVTDLLLDFLSLDYHETVMTPAGAAAEKSLADAMAKYAGEYICVIEGSIPTAQNGAFCTIRGRTALSIAREVTAKAKATVALGTCAWDGGLAAAAPNPTKAVGVKGAVPGVQNLIALPGCPSNVVNLVATLVYYITFKTLPDLDAERRPLFAYGSVIHETCERHPHYLAKEFVQAWGDEAHRLGWCLFKMGCKGPVTRTNCNKVRWIDSTSWPVQAGHGCVGCAAANFWDDLTPVYVSLPPES